MFGSYEQLLQMMFEWDGEPIQYLLTFFNYPQNDTSCGYFEKMIRPLILLKSNEIKPFLDISKWIQFIDQESIQNVFQTIFACNNLDENYKQDLLGMLLNQNNISENVFRIIIKYTDLLQQYLNQHQEIVGVICNQSPPTYHQLCTIELFMGWNILNLEWLYNQITYLDQLVHRNFDISNSTMNFLYKPQGLSEIDLKIIHILSQTVTRPETIKFQNVLLSLLIKYEWNNNLQNIAVNMYDSMSQEETPHKQYFQSIIMDFITNNVSFDKCEFGLKRKVERGYRWVFTRIVKYFSLNFLQAQDINALEGRFLLNEDPSNNREKQSLYILEKVSERRTQWAKRIQEEELQKQEEKEQTQMEVEEENNDNDQFFKSRNSFGIKPNNNEEEVEDEIPIRGRSSCQFKQDDLD
ncbi:unnamed protein product (macronuclear) [Paramecium tetraurelia]|uniref:Uncharacterized protein n=1 Tax=Paramecium tetraurelia TaxID=5888 RepID=A0D0Q0_PARTE|nr:uncharacterized protein GSPATT00012169001 [Paramecium tetraurelia]CAK76617.1 unnamed protein product [Paramecium tetraurelia]|eukprot:XP_001444014.1 hypothetical protein (macronuclear) [Paramecium tetraurelia strain d4-2]